MIRSASVLLVLLAIPAVAQEANQSSDPVLDVVFEKTEAIPGQMLSLRLTVLVPTFMPKPPVWPSFEVPNLLVRLPEGSTGPTSKRIGDETWSGVTRHYRISPMVAGGFVIPPQDVIVTYSDPENSEPKRITLTTDSLKFSGVIPDGAEDLDPFIAADELEMSQDVEGMPETMKPGDSLTRIVTVKVQGVSPMFLPTLLPTTTVEGIAAYPDEPILNETDNRGQISGSRSESATLVAEGGGSGEAPSVSLKWYDLQSGQVETASVDGFAISVDGPPARTTEPRDWRTILQTVFLGLVVLAAIGLLARLVLPRFTRWVSARRAAWRDSETRAYATVRRTISDRDFSALYPALDTWAEKFSGSDPRQYPPLVDALAGLGATRFGTAGSSDAASAWRSLARAVPEARHFSRKEAVTMELPPLNPSSPGR